MNFLSNLFGKKQGTTKSESAKGLEQSAPIKSAAKQAVSITLWARDEATGKSLVTDKYYLMGLLMADNSSASKNFLDALGKGGSLSHKVFSNSTKGGYNVELTMAW
jgi:hypothetical protein